MSSVAGPSSERIHEDRIRTPKSPLNVVGLLSGGKDSCYNLCHCAKLGHNIVALATLSPPQGKDELDSYMYQTVGHDAVHLIAEAMQLPLYRRTIAGTAINQTSVYGSRLPAAQASASTSQQEGSGSSVDGHDETEDLDQLLHLVKQHHPEVNAVSVGAILSNYQRVRVEHVARRADIALVPLSFLWQRNQRDLLDEMCTAGMQSILIKVAGAGLDASDLGKTLLQMRPKLHRLHKMYEAHICGEGGEYETLTLDCPLFKKRVQLERTIIKSHGEESSADVYYLAVESAHLVEKAKGQDLGTVSIPPKLDAVGAMTAQAARQHSEAPAAMASAGVVIPPPEISLVHRRGRWIAMGQICGKRQASKQDAFRQAFDTLAKELATFQLSTAHLQHVNVYIASQEHFATLNAVYAEYFGAAPPSRACVSIDLSSTDIDIILDAIALDDGQRFDQQQRHLNEPRQQRILRRNLHVQSLSHWASANIGPYSQAVDAMGRISIAGQIGLLPTTLELESRADEQIALSLQHARRIFGAILESRANQGQGWIESCICWVGGWDALPAARAAWLQQGKRLSAAEDVSSSDIEDGEDRWDEHWLGATTSALDVPFAFVVLAEDGLPRGASVEWQLTAHSGEEMDPEVDHPGHSHNTEDEEEEEKPPFLPRYHSSSGLGYRHQWTTARHAKSCGIIVCEAQPHSLSHTLQEALSQAIDQALHIRIFYTSAVDMDFEGMLRVLSHAAVTFVPVLACSGLDMNPGHVIIVWQGVTAARSK